MSRRRIALLLVLLACALPLGAWLVVGPALATRTAVPADPPIDLDMPAKSVRVATAASGASAARVGLASASAASTVAADQARCGEDQVAEYRDPEPDAEGRFPLEVGEPDFDGVIRRFPNETKAAGVGYTGALRRIDAALRTTGDPFDQAVADGLNIGGLRSQHATLEAVVQDARQSHDPRVDGVAFAMCAMATDRAAAPALAACANLDVRDWARDDPGNGVPWLYALQQAYQAGDRAGQQEALQQLASASRFDTRFGTAPAAVARLRLANDSDLAAQDELAQRAVILGFGVPVTPLASRCRANAHGDPQMAAACETIAVRMMDSTDSLVLMMIGGSMHKQVTGDGTRLDDVRREIHEFGERWGATEDKAPCSGERQSLQRFVQIGRHGEVALMREEAKAARHPRDAASR